MKKIAIAVLIPVVLLAVGCTGSDDTKTATEKTPRIQQGTIRNSAGTASTGQPIDTRKSKDLGQAVKGATDRAQQLTDEENKRVDDVNKAMDQ